MGALRAGFHGTVGHSSAQVIDGSLKFDKERLTYLTRTPGSSGNRNNWTISCWIKRGRIGVANQRMFESGSTAIRFGEDVFQWIDGGSGNNGENTPTAKIRDPGWYHLVFAWDSSAGVLGNRIYVNGVELQYVQTGGGNPSGNSAWNTGSQEHTIGRNAGNTSRYYDGMMSQCYFIDGLTLGPGYFGFTDPLTGTWRPKKFRAEGTTVNDGTQWSSFLSSTGALGFQANGFTGNVSTGAYSSDSSPITFTPPSTIHFQTLRVFTGSSGTNVANINGGSNIALNNNAWTTISNTGGSFSTLTVDNTTGNGTRINAIEVDGVVMVDSTTTNLDFGTNGFYLPMDGNSPIGQDKSGKGNDWTPVNFSGSTGVDKATGALPILEGPGGAVANLATRTDANASSLVLALPLARSKNDVSNQINSGTAVKTVTVNSAAPNSTYSNFYGGSYYFNGSSTLALSSLSGSNITDFTFESWIYLPNTSSQYGFFSNQTSDNNANTMRIGTSGGSAMWMKIGSNSLQTSSGTVPSARWFHLAVTRSGSTVTIYLDGINSATMSTSDYINASGFYVGVTYPTTTFRLNGYMQDVRFYTSAKYTSNFVPASPNPDVLPDTPSGVSGGSKLTKITDGAVSFGTNGYMTTTSSDYNPGTGDFAIEGYFRFPDNSGTRRAFINQTGGFGSGSMVIRQYNTGFEFYCGGQSFSDSGYNMAQWNHAMITRSGSTIRYFVNGELRATDTSSNSISASPTNQLTIGGYYSANNSEFMRGLASNLRLTVGSIPTDYQTSSTTVGEMIFTPSSEPLTSTSQGANSSHVKLLCCQSSTSATAAVSSASLSTNNTVTATTFNPFNTDINTVRGQETGYATLNPLDHAGINKLANGNLDFRRSVNDGRINSTITASSGKWYAECQIGNDTIIGISEISSPTTTYPGGNAGSYGYAQGGYFYDAGSGAPYAAAYQVDDYVGCILDLDNGTIEFTVNGVSQGVAKTGLPAGSYRFSSRGGRHDGAETLDRWNFGQKPFKFPPPDGFQPMNGTNLIPETVIARPDQYVGITTGNFDQQKTHVTGFQPDLIWHKARNQSQSNFLTDSVRGKNSYLISNSNNGAGTFPQGGQYGITSFNSNGWTQGGYGPMSEAIMVAWSWKAGGNKNTFNVDDVGYATAAAAGLTAGTDPSTDVLGASVGTKQGFSIIKYNNPDGGTHEIPHGLTQTPNLLISKKTSGTQDWFVHTNAIDGTVDYAHLNRTDSFNASSRTLTSTTVPMINSSGDFIAYIWHDVPGLQKFGSYTGQGANAASAYPYIELGFRPALIWIKDASTNGTHYDWQIFDSTRNPINLGNDNADSKNVLFANLNSQENKGSNPWAQIDFLSNGFRMNDASVTLNNSNGSTYIYCAWAEVPAFNLYGGQSNAR